MRVAHHFRSYEFLVLSKSHKQIETIKIERKITMRILFINNLGGGFADYIDVEDGTTIDKLFKQKISGENAEDYLIRVNRQPVPRDYRLMENDRVTITPTKIDGAIC
jgi:hypothetical protein